MGAGFRIYTRINRPARELVEEFRGLPAANIADEMNRFGCMDARIKPVNAVTLLGTAFTVKARIADNLLLHKATEILCCILGTMQAQTIRYLLFRNILIQMNINILITKIKK